MADQNKGKYPLKPMVERRAWIFWTNYGERWSKAKAIPDYCWHSIESYAIPLFYLTDCYLKT